MAVENGHKIQSSPHLEDKSVASLQTNVRHSDEDPHIQMELSEWVLTKHNTGQ
jgi:hypothetical protein